MHMLGNKHFIIVYIVLGITTITVALYSNIVACKNRPFSQFPVEVKGWRMTYQNYFTEDVLKILKPTDYLSRQYASDDGTVVDFYLGYHDGVNEGSGIHSPKHCLAGSGWMKIKEEKTAVTTNDRNIKFVTSIYQKGDKRELFLYWFIVQGKSFSDEYSLVLYELINYIKNKRKDSAFVRVSIPFENDEIKATNLGKKFISDFSPVIQEFLPPDK
jgi:EpsI family protein